VQDMWRNHPPLHQMREDRLLQRRCAFVERTTRIAPTPLTLAAVEALEGVTAGSAEVTRCLSKPIRTITRA
jgi:hypothetical protein